MISRSLGETRSRLAEGPPSGVDRRLLYPASGTDVGCSVGLFWDICDSFYLVDPMIKRSAVQDELRMMAEGRSKYMEGMAIESDGGTEGLFDGVQGVRYQVWRKGSPQSKKRLCFIKAGTNAWLDDTTTRYNVIVNKDYEGITGDQDSEFPYARIWERLNGGGLFAETVGDGRTSAELDCLAYRCRGFEPLWKVLTDEGEQIGFAEGLHLFRKVTSYHHTRYTSLDETFAKLKPLVQQPLTDAMFYQEYAAGLEELIGEHRKLGGTTWGSLAKSPAFLKWLGKWIKSKDPQLWQSIKQLNQATGPALPAELLAEQLKALKADSWGSF